MKATAARRLLLSVVVGLIAGVVVGVLAGVAVGVLTAIAVIETVFVVSGWVVFWRHELHEDDADEDLPPHLGDAVIVGATLGGLAGIVIVLALNGSQHRMLAAALALGGVFMTWATLHLVFAGRYARLYQLHGERGGIDFNDDRSVRPYRDFLYFSYNLGMTYQVSDTSVSDSTIRSTVLRHCLLSYLFGVAILATTINLVSSIVL